MKHIWLRVFPDPRLLLPHSGVASSSVAQGDKDKVDDIVPPQMINSSYD